MASVSYMIPQDHVLLEEATGFALLFSRLQ